MDFPVDMQIEPNFRQRMGYACLYYVAKSLRHLSYRHYVSHRPWSLLQEAMGWVKTGWMKKRRRKPDQLLLEQLSHHQGPLFLVPLQVAEDFQLREHSDYTGMDEFIVEVIRSFAHHASKNSQLLFKHHPMDRGYICYRRLIECTADQYGVKQRVYYGHELPLPKLYPLLSGVVTVNSTVGLSALLHKIPTICLGRALYDIKGLTSQTPLSVFWCHSGQVNIEKFHKLKASLLHLTQLNGSFYVQIEKTADRVAQRILADAQYSTEYLRTGQTGT